MALAVRAKEKNPDLINQFIGERRTRSRVLGGGCGVGGGGVVVDIRHLILITGLGAGIDRQDEGKQKQK